MLSDPEPPLNQEDSVKQTPTSQASSPLKNTHRLDEYYVDSLSVGRKGKNKLEIRQYRSEDSTYVTIDFYALKDVGWKKQNHFYFLKDGITGLETKLYDLNNDAYLDFSFEGSVAARGANDLRRVFIYNQVDDGLIEIKNSMQYPNLTYNKKMDCLNSFHYHGCSSQGFLRIETDSLVEFAWISVRDGIHVYEIDKNGNNIDVLRDTTNNYECYTFFETYDPLVEWKN